MTDKTNELVRKVTRAVRKADKHFDKVGGSSRHWVIECLLPCLEEEGLEIVSRSVPVTDIVQSWIDDKGGEQDETWDAIKHLAEGEND